MRYLLEALRLLIAVLAVMAGLIKPIILAAGAIALAGAWSGSSRLMLAGMALALFAVVLWLIDRNIQQRHDDVHGDDQ